MLKAAQSRDGTGVVETFLYDNRQFSVAWMYVVLITHVRGNCSDSNICKSSFSHNQHSCTLWTPWTPGTKAKHFGTFQKTCTATHANHLRAFFESVCLHVDVVDEKVQKLINRGLQSRHCEQTPTSGMNLHAFVEFGCVCCSCMPVQQCWGQANHTH
eukprot:1160680-Pelagomonas_calceolata.AAC.14